MGPFDAPFGFSIMFSIFPLMFMLVFGIIIYTIFKGIKENQYNNKQPIIPVDAKIVAKRYDVSHHRNAGNNMHHTSSSTRYYATFELTNGERMELFIPKNEVGMLVEGDKGILSFQGTRFISFERE